MTAVATAGREPPGPEDKAPVALAAARRAEQAAPRPVDEVARRAAPAVVRVGVVVPPVVPAEVVVQRAAPAAARRAVPVEVVARRAAPAAARRVARVASGSGAPAARVGPSAGA